MIRFLDLIKKHKKVTKRLKPVTNIEQWEFPTQDALDNYITVCFAVIYLQFIGETVHWFNERKKRISGCLTIKRIIEPTTYLIIGRLLEQKSQRFQH